MINESSFIKIPHLNFTVTPRSDAVSITNIIMSSLIVAAVRLRANCSGAVDAVFSNQDATKKRWIVTDDLPLFLIP